MIIQNNTTQKKQEQPQQQLTSASPSTSTSNLLLNKFQSTHIEYHQIVAPKPFVRKSLSNDLSTTNATTTTTSLSFIPKSQSQQVS